MNLIGYVTLCGGLGDISIPTYKHHTNHKKPSVSSHTLAQITTCDFSHSACRSPLTDLGHRSSVTYVCHTLWIVGGHRKGILTSPLSGSCYISMWTSSDVRLPSSVVRFKSLLERILTDDGRQCKNIWSVK